MKKKRILSLFLAVMMVFLVFTEHTPFSFAESGREISVDELQPGDIIVKILGADTDGIFKPNVGVVDDSLPGAAYPTFRIDVNLSRLSSSGGKDDGVHYDATPVDKRVKSGDVLRLPMPLNLELRDYFFKINKFPLKQKINENTYVTYANVTSDIEKDSSGQITKNDLLITFQDDSEHNFEVSKREFIKLFIEFETTVKIENSDEIGFDFGNLPGSPTLQIRGKKYLIYTDHILKKNVLNVELLDGGEYARFKFTLFANRKGVDLGQITLKDEIQNLSGDTAFNFNSVEFDKSSFKIEKGKYDSNKENEIPNGMIYETSGLNLNGDSFSFDDGIELKFIDQHNFELKVENAGTDGYKVTYGIKVPKSQLGRGYTISNDYKLFQNDVENEGLGYDETHKKPKVEKELKFLASGGITSSETGQIRVIKVDEDRDANGNEIPIKNVGFELFERKTITDSTGEMITKDEPTGHKATTDKNGEVYFYNLNIGEDSNNPVNYVVKEVETPIDYKAPDPQNEQIVSLYKANPNVSGDKGKIDGVLTFINERKTVDIKVNKVWAEGATEQDVIFTLKRHVKDGTPGIVDQVGVNPSKELKADDNSTNNSVTFTGLHEYDGKGNKYIYTVTEEPIDGYTSKVGELKPLEGNPTLYEVTVTNTKKPVAPAVKGKFKIKKVDSATGNALAGAQFRIVKKGGDVVVEKTAATGPDGTVTVELEIGEYIVKEVVAPTGYKLNNVERTVKLENTASVPEIEFKNDKESAGGIGGITPPPPTPPAPSEDSKPEEPKQDPPKKEEPKKEEPKPQPPEEEPQPPADGIGGSDEPTPPTPDEPIERLIGGGAGSGTNETNVLPGMIPKITGGGTSAGDPNSAVDPGYVPMLPKTGEGLNASSYAVLIAVLGMAFVLYGIYRRKKC